jgi:hypothetical protein
MSSRVMQWWHCWHLCQMRGGLSAHKVMLAPECLAGSPRCLKVGTWPMTLHALKQLSAPMAICGAGARGSILLERSADSGACSTDRAAPLNDVLEQLWRELDQSSQSESGCCTSDGAQIGYDGLR